MHLNVREVSGFLNVTEGTVTRWIKRRGLPAQFVSGQYRFHRAELLEWATANQIKVSLEMFDQFKQEDEPAPSLAKALEAGGIHYNVANTNKERALRALVGLLPLPDGSDRELLLKLFLAREAAASTAIGNGIAIPHVRNPIVLQVEQPLVTLCFLETPVDFGALDEKPVKVLFSLICPTTRSHLQLLARLTYALHDRKFKDLVLRPAQRDEILQDARRVEATLPAATAIAGKAAR